MQGLLAPFAASLSLLGIYLVVKYLPDLSLQTFLDAYFFLLGSFAISGAAASLLKVLSPASPLHLVPEHRYSLAAGTMAHLSWFLELCTGSTQSIAQE